MRSPADPLPPPPSYVEILNVEASTPVLLLCDHAGKEVPGGLGLLGIGEEALARHIGWDIGAAAVTRALARRLDASAVLNHCSRLVVDVNRHPRNPTSIPPVSDDCVIPGNRDLPPGAALDRLRRYFLPYHRAVARRIRAFRRRGVVPAVISLHSFTPRLGGEDRPWQVGVLWRNDRRLSDPALAALRARAEAGGGLVVGDNQPYSGLGEFGFTVEFHTQRTRLPHVMFEVRQDEIATRSDAERWAGILAEALEAPLADPGLYTLFDGPIEKPELEGFTWRQGSRL